MGNVQSSAPTLHLTAAAKYIKGRSVILCGDVCRSHIAKEIQEKQTQCVRLGVTEVHKVEKWGLKQRQKNLGVCPSAVCLGSSSASTGIMLFVPFCYLFKDPALQWKGKLIPHVLCLLTAFHPLSLLQFSPKKSTAVLVSAFITFPVLPWQLQRQSRIVVEDTAQGVLRHSPAAGIAQCVHAIQ